jgi:hypothetical protein
LVTCFANKQARDTARRFKETNVGRAFLANHSQKDLEIVLRFLRDPLTNFRDVQSLPDICSYIYAYANYLAESKGDDTAGYLVFLSTNFRTANEENVPVLTYLIMNCRNAFLGEAFADRYAVLFETSPSIFVKDLMKRRNWKQVVNELRGGNWGAFKAGLAKLGDSPFELELKSYVLSMERDKTIIR